MFFTFKSVSFIKGTLTMLRNCYLNCLLNSHPPIFLPHNTETIIGRSKETQIKDQSCSRRQLSLTANCEDCTVEIKQIGVNPSGLDGFSMVQGVSYTTGHGSKLELLVNNYCHVINFDPPPPISSPKKRRLSASPKRESKVNKSPKKDSPRSIQVSSRVAAENMWEEVDLGELYIYTAKGVKSSSKIAAFDMDGTLITTKSGKVFPVNAGDWKLAFASVSQKLKEHFHQDYKIVILSNQASIGSGKVKICDFKKKVEEIISKIDVPIQAYLATGKGFYRKPGIGMWKYLSEKNNDDIKIDMKKSFYVGDAAGRPAKWAPGKKKDHSMADKLLAENLQLTFYIPEQFFMGYKLFNLNTCKPDFNPKELETKPFNESLISEEKEILVLVGFPGSGKSFLAKQVSDKSGQKYAIVCRDELGSWQKCAAEAGKLLQLGKSVIVDSTNPDLESRARWTSLGRSMKVPVRCVQMTASLAHAKHNNKFRELRREKHVPVSDIVLHSYKNKYVEPTTKEGFKDVIPVSFSGCFKAEQDKELYEMHLLEK